MIIRLWGTFSAEYEHQSAGRYKTVSYLILIMSNRRGQRV